MKTIIIGMGAVGYQIAEKLSAEDYDIICIEKSRKRLEEVEESLDIQILHGIGTLPSILLQAGADTAQLVLAVTDNDEVNIVAATIAKRLGAELAIARVRNPEFVRCENPKISKAFGIDMLICPEVQAAQEIAKLIMNPGAIAIEEFADRRIQTVRLQVTPDNELIGLPLMDINIPFRILVACIERGDEILIPSGMDSMQEGDLVTLIGHPKDIRDLQAVFSEKKVESPKVFVVGGTEVALYLAKSMEGRKARLSLIERIEERSLELARLLHQTEVFLGDPMNINFLQEIGVEGANVFVAATDNDDHNLISCLLARRLGVEKVISLNNDPRTAPILEIAGITHAISPRLIFADRITAFIKRGNIASIANLHNGKAEIIEFIASENSHLIDKPLKEIKFPRGSIIASILRKQEVILPMGDTLIQAGDRVVAFVLAESAKSFEKLVRIK